MRRFTRQCAIAALVWSTVAIAASLPHVSAYRVEHGWPIYPAGFLLGEGSGVAVTPAGNVLAFHRAGRTWTEPLALDPIARPVLIELDGSSGNTLRQWGEGLFAMPHGLSTDRWGHIWVTDIALHQVIKLSPEGKPLLTLGERGVAGSDNRHFNRPTDVLVMPDGSFYVSDGYGNSRIMKFDAAGQFLFQWGEAGDGPGQFRTPHSLALTTSGLIAVADRNNSRVQLFTPEGNLVRQWPLPDRLRPFAITSLGGGRLAIVGNTAKADQVPDAAGGVIVDETGRVLARFGGYGRGDGQFVTVHDLAADRAGTLYAIDVAGARVQKFIARGSGR